MPRDFLEEGLLKGFEELGEEEGRRTERRKERVEADRQTDVPSLLLVSFSFELL